MFGAGHDAGGGAHLKALGLPTRMGDIPGFEASADDILAAMRQDKKVERGRLTFILVRGIGESFVARDLDEASVSTFLARELAAKIPRASRPCITRAWARAKIRSMSYRVAIVIIALSIAAAAFFAGARDRPDRSFSGADACA